MPVGRLAWRTSTSTISRDSEPPGPVPPWPSSWPAWAHATTERDHAIADRLGALVRAVELVEVDGTRVTPIADDCLPPVIGTHVLGSPINVGAMLTPSTAHLSTSFLVKGFAGGGGLEPPTSGS